MFHESYGWEDPCSRYFAASLTRSTLLPKNISCVLFSHTYSCPLSLSYCIFSLTRSSILPNHLSYPSYPISILPNISLISPLLPSRIPVNLCSDEPAAAFAGLRSNRGDRAQRGDWARRDRRYWNLQRLDGERTGFLHHDEGVWTQG